MTELYRKYRPTTFEQVIGQPDAISTIQSWGDEYPHAIGLTGPSGVGKTTIARIIRHKLDCHRDDFKEVNCADVRGIDSIRDIRRAMNYHAIRKTKIWLIDEAHQLTTDAQQAMLKMLEDTPDHVYFILATTDPQKLIPTIKTRWTEVRLRPIGVDDLKEILAVVVKLAGIKLDPIVADKIAEQTDGSARKALVFLDQIRNIPNPGEQRELIERTELKTDAIELFRLLIKPGAKWEDVAAILKGISGEQPESVRRLILACCTSCLLKGPNGRAAMIIDYFSRNFFDSGQAGLVWACWEILGVKK